MCATRGGVHKHSRPLLTLTFPLLLSFCLCSLLFSHFGDTQELIFYGQSFFDITRRNIIFGFHFISIFRVFCQIWCKNHNVPTLRMLRNCCVKETLIVLVLKTIPCLLLAGLEKSSKCPHTKILRVLKCPQKCVIFYQKNRDKTA